MRLKEILSEIKEKWYKSVKGKYGKYADVFVNPSIKDINEMEEFIRFLVDGRNKKLYVTDAFGGVFHTDLYEISNVNHKEIIAGGFRYKKGKLMLLRDESIVLYDNEESLLSGEWDWMEKYHVDMTWFKGIVNVDRVRKIDNIQGLKEKFVTSVKDSIKNEDYREIFKNPSRSDIRDLDQFSINAFRGEIRFIADPDKKDVYISTADVFHDDIARESGYMPSYFLDTFPGTGKIRNGKIVVLDGGDLIKDYTDDEIGEEILNGKYDFLKKYNFDMKSLRDYAKEVISVKESFAMGVKDDVSFKYKEVFVNPTGDDLKDVEKYKDKFKFIADKESKDVYIFPVNVYHETIGKEVNFSDYFGALFSGLGRYVGGRVDIVALSPEVKKSGNKIDVISDIRNGEYDWMERYRFNIENYK